MASSRVTARVDRSSHAFPPGQAIDPYRAIRTMPLALLLVACGGAPFTVAEQTAALDVAGDAGPSSDEPGQVAEQVSDPPDAAPQPVPVDAAPEAAEEDVHGVDAAVAEASEAGSALPDAATREASVPDTWIGLSCNGATCAGCCDSAGVCQGGSDDATCGQGGQSCMDCTTRGLICSTGSCVH